jgi:ABC-type uncharacterized transport system permease subunit
MRPILQKRLPFLTPVIILLVALLVGAVVFLTAPGNVQAAPPPKHPITASACSATRKKVQSGSFPAVKA